MIISNGESVIIMSKTIMNNNVKSESVSIEIIMSISAYQLSISVNVSMIMKINNINQY